MKNIKDAAVKAKRPVKALQFGEGNFLRAFADWMIDEANAKGAYNGSIAVVQPIDAPLLPYFEEQDCMYTAIMRGKEDGAVIDEPRLVTSVAEVISAYRDYGRFMEYASCDSLETIISNTTEAGIVFDEEDRFEATPPNTYPGKLTKFLFERFTCFAGDNTRGLTIFPVELIENNGGKLKECVKKYARLWSLGESFEEWIEVSCMFCSTLVDRIVTGYPKKPGEAEKICEKLGYADNLIDIGEPFALWVIEAPDIERARRALPLDAAGLPVIFTDDQRPYRERKVRVLNGAHTSFVPAAFLSGENIVRDCMKNEVVRRFIDAAVYQEIAPTVKLPIDEVKAFADSVCERFENPFIDHELLSICLNSVSKWRARVLPSIKDCLAANGELPPCLTMSFASLCEFYSRGEKTDEGFRGERNGEKYTISDDVGVIDFFEKNGKKDDVISLFASKTDFWGEDLTLIPSFVKDTEKYFRAIREEGAADAMSMAADESESRLK